MHKYQKMTPILVGKPFVTRLSRPLLHLCATIKLKKIVYHTLFYHNRVDLDQNNRSLIEANSFFWNNQYLMENSGIGQNCSINGNCSLRLLNLLATLYASYS